MRRGFILKCYTGSGSAGGFDFGELSGGRLTISVNVESLSCSTDTYVKSTMFHEALHGIFGGHDPYGEAILPTSNPWAYTYGDRLRSCEALCFGGEQRVFALHANRRNRAAIVQIPESQQHGGDAQARDDRDDE